MTRTLLLCLSLLPGAGPILLGHGLFGSLLMVVGLVGYNFILLGFLLWHGPEGSAIGWTGVAIGPVASIVSLVWTAMVTSPQRRERRRSQAQRALEVASVAYLRDHLRGAWTAVRYGLVGAREDADLLFLAWCLARRLPGQQKKARRLLRRLRSADGDGKWSWEIEEELAHTPGRLSERIRRRAV